MKSFIQHHQANVTGTLEGFDRVRLRGTLRQFCYTQGLFSFLCASSILLKDFVGYAKGITEQIREQAKLDAQQSSRPYVYLRSSRTSKEQLARDIAQRDGVTNGLVCVLTSLEPCYTYDIFRNRETKRLELQYGPGKCLHQYHYFQDPVLGFLNVRLQTWFPFTMHVCINGREWLARQMDTAGLGYVRRDNCFTELQDAARAQQLMNEQLRVSWQSQMNRLTKLAHPLHRTLFGDPLQTYYWSIAESEWATDIMFRSPEKLAELYPQLLRHGMTALGSVDVMRFLGHRIPAHGGVHGKFQGEVVTDLKSRPEGARIKHRAGANSIKMYDKQGSVLRIETTLNDAGPFKTFRKAEKRASRTKPGNNKKCWRPLRKAVADVGRRAAICRGTNKRYLESLAKVEDTTPLGKLTDKLCQRTEHAGRSVRALNPWGEADATLLAAVTRGEFALQGFRNGDLRALLYENQASITAAEQRRQSSAVGRKLKLLQAHGLIKKIAKTHRYQLTEQGRTTLTALQHARQANTRQLVALAA
jgi:hypothetical protein